MITRWNGAPVRRPADASWDALGNLRREMDTLFANFDRESRGSLVGRGFSGLELSDVGEALTARMEVPGFGDEEIQIQLTRTTLTVRGERRTDAPEGYSVHRQERGALSFARAVTLPCHVVAEEATANLRDGVLELCLPKAPEEQARTINVQPAS